MPRTVNPTWTRDELILALDVYLRHGAAGKTHPAVLELSDLLQRVGPKSEAKDPDKFRNVNGVGMKLGNFMAVDPGTSAQGLDHGGKKAEGAIWNEFDGRPGALAGEVARIKSQAAQGVGRNRPPTYWALVASPRQYGILDAIAARDSDLWTIGGHDVREGDWAVIWKSKGRDDRRGVVALAEVISGPEEALHDVPEWLDDTGRQSLMRVRIRYANTPDLPLWLDGPADEILRDLSVSRATGGGVFRVTPEQWERILEAAGGAVSGDAVIEEAARPRGRGQGLMSDVQRKLAVEHHAVALATQYFEAQDWSVENVGSWACYDLHCRRGVEELHVEVKGTTGAGVTVSLTANEVQHAETHPNVALVVVTDIAISASPDPVASGGKVAVFDPWHLDWSSLRARVYEYIVPNP